MLLSKATYSAFRLYIFCQYGCSLGIEPTTVCTANAMLYHWATGTVVVEPDVKPAAVIKSQQFGRCCSFLRPQDGHSMNRFKKVKFFFFVSFLNFFRYNWVESFTGSERFTSQSLANTTHIMLKALKMNKSKIKRIVKKKISIVKCKTFKWLLVALT